VTFELKFSSQSVHVNILGDPSKKKRLNVNKRNWIKNTIKMLSKDPTKQKKGSDQAKKKDPTKQKKRIRPSKKKDPTKQKKDPTK
jgi:hypothetical protein